MEKIVTLLTVLWTKVRVANARAIAHIFSRYSSKSSPAICGEETFYFETYSPSIQKLCDKWGISNSTHQANKPGRFAKWFLSMFLGWPWPIRMLVYKGKRLDAIATNPEEMIRLLQKAWCNAVNEPKMKTEVTHSPLSEAVPRPRHSEEERGQSTARAKTITRIANPPKTQNRRLVRTMQSASLSNNQPRQDTYAPENILIKEDDDIMEFSF